MANSAQEPGPPKDLPNVPADIAAGAGQTRLIVEAVKESVAELKADVKEIKSHRFSDMLWHLGAAGAAIVVIGGMLIAAYFRLEDKIHELSTLSTRVETKLDDLLARIPPVPTPPPKKN